MKVVGIVSNDVLVRTRILDVLEDKDLELVQITEGNFDQEGFHTFLVDLNSPVALVVLAKVPQRCIAFSSAQDQETLKRARASGCERVYGIAKFFKEVLPSFSI